MEIDGTTPLESLCELCVSIVVHVCVCYHILLGGNNLCKNPKWIQSLDELSRGKVFYTCTLLVCIFFYETLLILNYRYTTYRGHALQLRIEELKEVCFVYCISFYYVSH